MSITLGAVTLPDLHWADEFDWTPVAQSFVYTESGALIREESAVQAGRPITLVGDRDYAWVQRAAVKGLYTLQASALASPMTLVLDDGRTFAVIWRRDGGTPPMTARPVRGPVSDPDDGEWYSLTLRLTEV